ncbi:MAG: type IV secretory system conjugative DNA transfer family protein, partial [Solirubrobacteraceae bacterium]
MSDWGPSHQQPRARISDSKKLFGAVCFAAAMVSPLVFHLVIWTGLFYGGARINRRFGLVPRLRAFLSGGPDSPPPAPAVVSAPAVYLGIGQGGQRRWSRAGRAVLVIGPSQSGKTTSVIIPTLLDYPGPVVSTSTKPDVLRATIDSRLEFGRAWQFDPTGHADEIPGAETLRWSPLGCSRDWDGALLMARAMVAGAAVGSGVTDANHWAKRAQALLAAVLHAAAITEVPMRTVIGWVTSHDIDQPLGRLRDHANVPLALDVLSGIANTEERERSSIFSATADALDAYTSQSALDAAEEQNFDASRLVASGDTVYI